MDDPPEYPLAAPRGCLFGLAGAAVLWLVAWLLVFGIVDAGLRTTAVIAAAVGAGGALLGAAALAVRRTVRRVRRASHAADRAMWPPPRRRGDVHRARVPGRFLGHRPRRRAP